MSSHTFYSYTNESYGDSTQLLYLRSRYYASGTGRFLTRDTWGGDYNTPLSLNRWSYTTANPINFVDPSGRISEKENIDALIIAEALRIDYNVKIDVDWGHPDWIQGKIYGLPRPNFGCDEWQYGKWRSLQELQWVYDGVRRLATKMGGPSTFKVAMKYRPVEVARVEELPWPAQDNTGLAWAWTPPMVYGRRAHASGFSF